MDKRGQIALALLAVATLAGICMAAPASAITLEESVEMALSRSESAALVEEGTRAMRAGARAEASEFWPHVGLDAGYYSLGTNAEPNPFIPMPDQQYEAALNASQLLWAGGRVSKGFRLKSAVDAKAELTGRIGLGALRYRVASMYYGVLFSRARMGVLGDRVEQREQEMADAEALGRAGVAAPLDVRQAALSLSMARDALLEGELGYRQALVDFNIELGNVSLGEEGLLTPEGELGRADGLAHTLSSLSQGLEEESLPEIRLSGLELKEAGLRLAMEKGRWFPELRAVASAGTSGEEASAMYESWMAGINLKFDFYDGGLRGAKRAGARAGERRAGQELERTRKTVAGRVLSMRMRSTALDERIRLRTEAVAMAEENYSDARAQYRAGLITLTSLGEFNLALAEARLGLLHLYLDEQALMSEAALLMGSTR